MKRILVTVALSAALLAGGSATAEASAPRPFAPNGVKICIHALKWAHAKPTEAREDRAVIICGRTVTTEAQATVLYRWANRKANRWALELIG